MPPPRPLHSGLRRPSRLLVGAFLLGVAFIAWSTWTTFTYETLRDELGRSGHALAALDSLELTLRRAGEAPDREALALVAASAERLDALARQQAPGTALRTTLAKTAAHGLEAAATLQAYADTLAAAPPDRQAALAHALFSHASAAADVLPATVATLRARQRPVEAELDRLWQWLLVVVALACLVTLAALGLLFLQQHALRARIDADEALMVARDRAEAGARLEAAFLANMSHEIRTPLTALIGVAGALREDLPPAYAPLAEVVLRSSRRLHGTLSSILEIASLEARGSDLPLAPVEVGEVARDVIDTLQGLAEPKGLSLRLDAPPAVWAWADSCALGRVLIHLTGNAIKFTDHGTVTVRLHAEEDAVHIDVADTGCGISEAFRPFLFSKFRQEHMGTDRTYEGSGLGLAITHRLVTLQGGTIDVASRPGAGTTFTVRLQRAAEPPALADVAAAIPQPAVGA